MTQNKAKRVAALKFGLHRAFGAAWVALSVGLSAPAVSAPDMARVEVNVTPTRLVWLFQGKERTLLDAQAKAKAEVVESLLSEDFMQRSASRPEAPLGRSEWLAASRAGLPKDASISQMMVHEHGPLAIASFVLAGPRGEASFVVDVWRQREGIDNYELLTRYLSPAPMNAKPRMPATRPQIPGAPAR
jgi:hypothetical protein